MATNQNALACTYVAGGVEIKLDAQVVRNYITTNPNVTDQEIKFFVELCKARQLNPFIKDVHLIKYGDSPASIIVGKDAFARKASQNPKYKGFKAGIIVESAGQILKRDGAIKLKDDKLLGGWAEVYVEGYESPVYVEADFSAFNTDKANWKKMPALMIRKVALVQAWREAFPEDYAGMYSEEEMGNAAEDVNPMPIDPPAGSIVEADFEVIEGPSIESLLDRCKRAVDVGVDRNSLNDFLKSTFMVERVQDISAHQVSEAIELINQTFGVSKVAGTNPKAIVAASLKVLADALKAESEAGRLELFQELQDFYETYGVKSMDVKLPSGDKIGSLSLSFSKEKTEVCDSSSLLAYIEEAYPTVVKVVPEHTEISSAFVDELLKRLEWKGDIAIDPTNGCIVPGLSKVVHTGPKSFSIRQTSDEKQRVIHAWQSGELAYILPGIAPVAVGELPEAGL